MNVGIEGIKSNGRKPEAKFHTNPQGNIINTEGKVLKGECNYVGQELK